MALSKTLKIVSNTEHETFLLMPQKDFIFARDAVNTYLHSVLQESNSNLYLISKQSKPLASTGWLCELCVVILKADKNHFVEFNQLLSFEES